MTPEIEVALLVAYALGALVVLISGLTNLWLGVCWPLNEETARESRVTAYWCLGLFWAWPLLLLGWFYRTLYKALKIDLKL